ncbi:hypothetical protein HG530_013112 [Fusarium avenaceum]|nr:hypothetical protein HG530_013112 [Fusarium avenaceum]
MDSPRLYHKLPSPDSIRLLELTQDENHQGICGHLVLSKLEDGPSFAALSYVWGSASPEDPILKVDGFDLKIRQSLKHALEAIVSGSEKMLLWIDQICIDQENYAEREIQVALMAKIFRQAQRVICWLGLDDKTTKVTFDLITFLAAEGSDLLSRQESIQRLTEAGYFSEILDLFDTGKLPLSALVCLVKKSWFSRLWIVQEVAFASKLEFRCGSSSIDGNIFFEAIKCISSILQNPPAPSLINPFRHAARLGQLRAHVADAIPCSYPHLAHTFSTWNCTEVEDRLNALFGLAFPYNSNCTWFQPKYDLTGPELFIKFAKDHIKENGNLDILHFSGCGDSKKYLICNIDGTLMLVLRHPNDDLPSWVPDWRVRSRSLVLLPDPGSHANSNFTATLSKADYFFDESEHKLHVRALLVDEIVECGLPYYPSLCRALQIPEHGVFKQWYELAKDHLNSDTFESMFSSTLVMNARMTLTERGALNVEQHEIPNLFKDWERMMMDDLATYVPDDNLQVVEGCSRYGYVAEEICRNRNIFITKKGRLGLGSIHITPVVVLQESLKCLAGDGPGRTIRHTSRATRKDGRIHNPQLVNAVHTEPRVNAGFSIIFRSHRAGRRGMMAESQVLDALPQVLWVWVHLRVRNAGGIESPPEQLNTLDDGVQVTFSRFAKDLRSVESATRDDDFVLSKDLPDLAGLLGVVAPVGRVQTFTDHVLNTICRGLLIVTNLLGKNSSGQRVEADGQRVSSIDDLVDVNSSTTSSFGVGRNRYGSAVQQAIFVALRVNTIEVAEKKLRHLRRIRYINALGLTEHLPKDIGHIWRTKKNTGVAVLVLKLKM